MGKEDFRTLYRAEFSSGGALQNITIPSVIHQMSALRTLIHTNYDLIEPLKEMIETLTEIHQIGFLHPETIQEKLKICKDLIKEWKSGHANQKPVRLLDEMKRLHSDFWWQFNRSGAGIVYSAHDPDKERKEYNAILGRG